MNLFNKRQNTDLGPGINFLPGGPVRQSNRLVATLSVALVVVSGMASYLGYLWYQDKAVAIIDQTQTPSQTETEKLVAEIGQLLVLPADEQPTVATVTDLEALKGQPFFLNAKVGYKVLIYTKSKRAILYDPQAKKIVEVAPINLGNQPTI